MFLRAIILVTWLAAVAFPAAAQEAEERQAAEQRLDKLLAGVDDLKQSPDSGKELYLRMESGFALVELERYEAADFQFARALEISRELDEPSMVVTNLSSLVEVSFYLGDLVRGRELSAEAIDVAESMGRDDLIQRLEMNLGSIELRLGEHVAAVNSLSRAIDLNSVEDDPESLGTLLNNLAVAYMALSDYDQAKLVLDRTLLIMIEIESNAGIAAVLSNEADLHFLKGEAQLALDVMQESLALRLEGGLEGASSISYRGIGQALHALGRNVEAGVSFDKALEIQRRLDLKPEIGSTLAAMADMYCTLDRYDEAKAAAFEGAALAESMHMRDIRMLNLDALSRAYSGQGNAEGALRCEREARELQQEASAAELVGALKEFYVSYEDHGDRHELIFLRKDNQLKRLQRNTLIVGAGFLLAAALAGWTFYVIRGRVLGRLDEANRDLSKANKKTLARTGELEVAMKEVRDLQEDGVRAAKLESLGVLAAGIAHDFNNVLATVLGNVTMARARLSDRMTERGMLLDAEDAVDRGRRLSSQLLAFSKGGAPLRELHSLPKVLRSAVTPAVAESNVSVSFQFPEELWPLEIDAAQVSQLATNLVTNAVHAMPEGGAVVISAQNVSMDSNGDGRGPLIRVSVSDSGPGIPEAIRKGIFDPYFTTKDRARGLGLTTAYAIANRHGGTLRLCPDGPGATFEFDLPAAPGKSLVAPTAARGVEQGGGRLLVLDDDALVLNFYKHALDGLGYEAVLALDGPEAIARFEEAKEEGRPFDMVILDLSLAGGIGGTEVLAELLLRDPDVLAIVASGYADSPVLANYREEGFVGVLTKPFGLGLLSQVLKDALAERDPSA